MKFLFLFFNIFIFIGCQSKNYYPEPIIDGKWFKPKIKDSWQWQLSSKVNTTYDVDIYDIDLFDSNKSLINNLHQDGKKVICYFSAGSYEEWREDKDSFPKSTLGKELDGWKGERWLDIRDSSILDIMKRRLSLAVKKGCDGVEPDNVDAYTNDSGFSLNAQDQLFFNKTLANEAHKLGLSIALKNSMDQIQELEPYFDFIINEQCHKYNECDILSIFIKNNKPVFNIEYNKKNKKNICLDAKKRKFQTLILPLELNDKFRISCQ